MVDQKYVEIVGRQNLPDAKFCANCGATIVSACRIAVRHSTIGCADPIEAASTVQPTA